MQMQQSAEGVAYKGVRDAFKQIVRKEGFMALYKGFGTNTLGVVTSNVYVTAYEVARQAFTRNISDNAVAANLVGGASASLLSQTFLVPLDMVSQRMMVSTASKADAQGPFAIIRSVLKEQGVRGLYRGYCASLVTYAPYSAIWWGTYGVMYPPLLDFVTPTNGTEVPQWKQSALQSLSGFSAGTIAAILTNPMDVVRTRTQVYGDRTARQVFRDLIEKEGPRAFGRGAVARASATGPVGAIMLPAYEFLKRISKKPTDE